MDATPVISSGADLAAMASPDLFSGIEDIPVPNPEGEALEASPVEDSSEIDTLEAPAPVEDTPEPGIDDEPLDEPTENPEQPEPPAVPDKPEEELPEGVKKGKDRNGKQGYFLEENRYQTFHNNHKLVQQASEMLGEPATAEALQIRNEAYLAQERLYSDLTSGDPKAQGAVLNYFMNEMARSREAGEIGSDAAVPLAQSFYAAIREKSPEGYAQLRMDAARDLIAETFQEAAAKGDESLWLSAQHMSRMLANVGKDVMDPAQIRAIADRMKIPFYTKAEMAGLSRGADPTVALRAENERLKAQVEGRTTTNQAAQFDQWNSDTSEIVKTALLDEAVKPALASVEAGWKKFPDDYNRLVVDPLNREVAKVIRADAGFKEKIDRLQAQAQRATSAQRRDEIRQQIKTSYVNRAKLAADAVKKPILEFAANRLKEQADQKHARRQGAQDRTAPRGQGSAVPRSILPGNIPKMGDTYDPKVALQQMAAVIG